MLALSCRQASYPATKLAPLIFFCTLVVFVVAATVATDANIAEASQSMAQPNKGNHEAPSVTVLFQQPVVHGLGGRLLVPSVNHVAPPAGEFHLVLWEPNPHRRDGRLVATDWSAGNNTGFYPPDPLRVAQAGFQDIPGTTTAQMDGDTVGVYLNSKDLPNTTHKQKMMITPSFWFLPGQQPALFSQPGSVLNTSMELQVPTASDRHNPTSNTYIVAEFLFKGPHNVLISYGVILFFNGVPHSRVSFGYDQDSHSLMINSPLGEDNRFVAQESGGGFKASVPWTGWRLFKFHISYGNFVGAINELAHKFPSGVVDRQPEDYSLVQFHLNAELHFGGGPAQLGWSMRRLRLAVNSAEPLPGAPARSRHFVH